MMMLLFYNCDFSHNITLLTILYALVLFVCLAAIMLDKYKYIQKCIYAYKIKTCYIIVTITLSHVIARQGKFDQIAPVLNSSYLRMKTVIFILRMGNCEDSKLCVYDVWAWRSWPWWVT